MACGHGGPLRSRAPDPDGLYSKQHRRRGARNPVSPTTSRRAGPTVLAKAGTSPGTERRVIFESRWGVPQSWNDVILQGPHLYVATPMYKSPNVSMKHNQDWSATDFEALAMDEIPATSYKPAGSRARYDADYTHWKSQPHGITTVSMASDGRKYRRANADFSNHPARSGSCSSGLLCWTSSGKSRIPVHNLWNSCVPYCRFCNTFSTETITATINGVFTGCVMGISSAGSGGSQGLPSMAARMASRAVMPWAAAESR